MGKVKKFKGYEIVDTYPNDGWLKGYFYVTENDIKDTENKLKKAYRD